MIFAWVIIAGARSSESSFFFLFFKILYFSAYLACRYLDVIVVNVGGNTLLSVLLHLVLCILVLLLTLSPPASVSFEPLF